jgi:hypothetical protein
MSVSIELDGKKVELKFSVEAAQQISTLGGIKGALNNLAAFDLDSYALIILAGSGEKPIGFGDVLSGMRNKVYRTGIVNLTAPLAKYVSMLANGGREIEELKADGGQ